MFYHIHLAVLLFAFIFFTFKVQWFSFCCPVDGSNTANGVQIEKKKKKKCTAQPLLSQTSGIRVSISRPPLVLSCKDINKSQRTYLNCIVFVSMNSEALTVDTKRRVLTVNIFVY